MQTKPLTRIRKASGRAIRRTVATLTVGLVVGWPFVGKSTISSISKGSGGRGVETLVLVRHAEKPAEGLGLLTCKGLNRALLLPDFFAANFDQPDYIFAPNPAVKVTETHGNGQQYDYVRPLLTIGPTAVRFGIPINTELPFNAPGLLADTLLDPKYHNDTIYVAWEHTALEAFAKILLNRFQDLSQVPHWSNSDYNTFYVFRIDWAKVPSLKFEVRSENLGPISENCPQVSKP